MKLICSLCEEPVQAHCEHQCAWAVCTNRGCDAMEYDVYRGVLRLRSGMVEDIFD